MKKHLLLMVLAGAGAGCSSNAAQLHLSAGRVGCSTTDIVIGNVDSTSHSETWSATCRGVTYYCSATDEFREVVCKSPAKPNEPAQ